MLVVTPRRAWAMGRLRNGRTRCLDARGVSTRALVAVTVLALGVASTATGTESASILSSARDDDGDSGEGRDSTLSSWLAKFTFDVPTQTFRVPYAGIEVELSAFRCSNVSVGALTSDVDSLDRSFGAVANDDQGELTAYVKDLGFMCDLRWSVTDRFRNRAIGDAKTEVAGSDAQFSLGLDVDPNGSPPLPREIKLTNCRAHITATDLSFNGGRFATVLNAASPAIRVELSRTLSALACSGFASGLENFSGTASGQRWEDGQLARDERAMASFFRPAEPASFPRYNATAGVSNLSTSPLVRWLEYMSEAYIGAQGPRSVSAFARWIEDQNERNDENNVNVVRVPPVWLFDSQTHLPKMSLMLSKEVLREISSTVEGAAFVVYDMKVVGLETATTLRGPSVVKSPATLNSSDVDTELQFTIGWKRVFFNISGVLDILPTSIKLDPWIEPLIVSLELHNPEFTVGLGLAIDEMQLRQLKGTRQANVACLAQTIISARVLSLDWSGQVGPVMVNPWRLNEPVDESDDTLEASLDALITRASLLITEKLEEAVHRALSHQLGSTTRNALNEELHRRLDYMRSSKCQKNTGSARSASSFKRVVSMALLYAALFCAGMFVTVLFGYFTLVVTFRKMGRRCFYAIMRRIISISAHEEDEWVIENDQDFALEDTDSRDDDNDLSYVRQFHSRRNYSRASFHSGRRAEATVDDTSIITESLLGEAEIDEEGNIDIDEKSLIHRPVALCDSLVVPRSAKYGLPILYAMTFLLFLSSNLSVGATLSVRAIKRDVQFPEDNADILLPEVIVFSLGNTVANMWRAGVYTLSVLILLFSGVWPYVKLVTMWVSWSVPILDSRTRGRTLKLLDDFGKWSLLDAFVMMLFMVLFHFEITTSPDVTGFGALTISVRPQRGFFVFLASTVLSMILGHVTTGYHRLNERCSGTGDEYPVEHMQETAWHRMQMSATKKWLLSMAVTAMMVGTSVALIFGFKSVAMRFTMLGIAGAALGPDDSTRSMSLRSVAVQVRNASPELHPSLSRLIEWTMLIYAFIVPLLRISTVTMIWTMRLHPRDRRSLWWCKDVLDAWSALDVMLFSFVAAISQIREFLAFMLGGNCDALNDTLQQLVAGPLSHTHDLCFDVDSSLGDGCWLLAACVVGSWASSRAVEFLRDDQLVEDYDENDNDNSSEHDTADDDAHSRDAFATPL